jgi:ATP-binding cassette, subfamily B, bacterial HlyB/CyaB
MKDGFYRILVQRLVDGRLRIADPLTRIIRDDSADDAAADWSGEIILVTRRFGGAGIDPATFGFRWFLPSIWRYRGPLAHVLLASLFVQLFALITPLFFQIIIDKVLVHKGLSTLIVIVAGLVAIGLFDVTLQYLRSYALSHTTSRIDVELGSRVFDHLLRLPLSYFETRPTGQTVARVREVETIRNFLTGQGLSSVIDLLFAIVFVAVMFLYSTTPALIVLCSIPFYLLIAYLVRPALRQKINERFNTGAASQQFLVESVFGIQTLKAAAVEPILRNEWDDRLAAYVKTSFQAVILSNFGQNAIQYINKVTIAAVLFFGAKAVIDSDLTIGGLVAFYMIMNQATAPILRLSQLWQSFQQVQISVQRLGGRLSMASSRSSPKRSRPRHGSKPPSPNGRSSSR